MLALKLSYDDVRIYFRRRGRGEGWWCYFGKSYKVQVKKLQGTGKKVTRYR